MEPKILVISSSLRPGSTSRLMALKAVSILDDRQTAHEFLDLKKLTLPFCDGKHVFQRPEIRELEEQITRFDGILIASPVYNFDVNAALKNLIELTGHAWLNKVIGFMCSAGSRRSYMSILPFANSLMLDFRCIILPRFVFATGADFQDGTIHNPTIEARIEKLTDAMISLTSAFPDLQL